MRLQGGKHSSQGPSASKRLSLGLRLQELGPKLKGAKLVVRWDDRDAGRWHEVEVKGYNVKTRKHRWVVLHALNGTLMSATAVLSNLLPHILRCMTLYVCRVHADTRYQATCNLSADICNSLLWCSCSPLMFL